MDEGYKIIVTDADEDINSGSGIFEVPDRI